MPLLFTLFTAHGMEKKQIKKWNRKAKALKQLATNPEKNFRIEGNSVNLSKDKIRALLVSIISAVYKENGSIVLDSAQLDKYALNTLAGNQVLPKSINPHSVTLTNTNGEGQFDHHTTIKDAITLHYQDPEHPYITADFSMLKKLFATPFILKDRTVTEVIFTNEDKYPKNANVREILTEAVTLNTREDIGTVTMTVDCSQLKNLLPKAKEVEVQKIVEKKVIQKQTLLQRFIDPVTLGTAVTVGAVCWFMAQQESE